MGVVVRTGALVVAFAAAVSVGISDPHLDDGREPQRGRGVSGELAVGDDVVERALLRDGRDGEVDDRSMPEPRAGAVPAHPRRTAVGGRGLLVRERAEPGQPAPAAGEAATGPDSATPGTQLPARHTFVVAAGRSPVVGTGPVVTFVVEVQDGANVVVSRFAEEVERILFDPRGWTADGRHSLQRVDSEPVDFRITLAVPEIVDELCHPLQTEGVYSCWNEERAVINLWRWHRGAEAYGHDLANYRRYLVNHEVGHALGHGHADCPGPRQPAPVMMQQTVGVADCDPNPWPFGDDPG